MNKLILSRALLCGGLAVLACRTFSAPAPVVVHGRCSACEVPFRLGKIHFVDDQEGWSSAYWWPPVNGSERTTMLHTTDGGRHWHRLPFVWQQGPESGPAYSFVDRKHGWIAWSNAREAIWRLSRTTDGGHQWTHRESDSLAAVSFSDPLHGYAVGVSRLGQWSFRATADGGDTWHRVTLPMSSVGLVSFANPNVGVIVGAAGVEEGKPVWDGVLCVLATHDGGSTWTRARLPGHPYAMPITSAWMDARNGFFAVWGDDDKGSELWQTSDGGQSWTRHSDQSFQGAGKYIQEIAFTPDGSGFLFYEEHGDRGTIRNRVAATVDRGATWNRSDFRWSVHSCQLMGRSLWCSTGMDVLKLGPSDLQRLTGKPGAASPTTPLSALSPAAP
jgi:photosystem II stability/assembly factor-like uncharacterized protein